MALQLYFINCCGQSVQGLRQGLAGSNITSCPSNTMAEITLVGLPRSFNKLAAFLSQKVLPFVSLCMLGPFFKSSESNPT